MTMPLTSPERQAAIDEVERLCLAWLGADSTYAPDDNGRCICPSCLAYEAYIAAQKRLHGVRS